MTEYVERLEKRMSELTDALEKHRKNPDMGFEEIKSVDMLIKFEIFLNDSEVGITDGLYIYVNEDNQIVNAEYFYNEEGDLTIVNLSDEQLQVITELFNGVFTINVE